MTEQLAGVSTAAHGFIFFGSLMPLSIVDGGTLLKWTLVERGLTPEAADQRVKRAGVASILAGFLGVVVWLARRCSALDAR